MALFRMNSLQWAVHTAAWVLFCLLIWQAYTGELGVNPVQAAMQRTGFFAITYLVLSLVCSPLSTFFGWKQAIKARRPLGVYAFLFAATHVLIFLWIDFGWQWEFLRQELVEKRYIWAGMSAFLILVPLALTSFKRSKKQLGKNWKRLHRMVYLAAPLAGLHFAWARKGDLFRLQGDIVLPLVYALVIMGLLIVRLPPIKGLLRGTKGRRGRSAVTDSQ
jgi:methionine sulfoxide reductase heme-binding subunit